MTRQTVMKHAYLVSQSQLMLEQEMYNAQMLQGLRQDANLDTTSSDVIVLEG